MARRADPFYSGDRLAANYRLRKAGLRENQSNRDELKRLVGELRGRRGGGHVTAADVDLALMDEGERGGFTPL